MKETQRRDGRKTIIRQLSYSIACNKGQSEPAGSWLLFFKSLEPLRGEVSGSVPLLQAILLESNLTILHHFFCVSFIFLLCSSASFFFFSSFSFFFSSFLIKADSLSICPREIIKSERFSNSFFTCFNP